MTKLIQRGNKKLRGMYMFNIPASKEICGRVCPDCYSYKAYRMYPNVLPAQTERYEATKKLDFVLRIKTEIESIKVRPKHFRIHGSAGEFYSYSYLSNWVRIASYFPDIIFYTYTKRMKDFDFSLAKATPNFVVIDSFHFKGLNYGKVEDAPVGSFICPDIKNSNTQCGVDCTYCQTKGAVEDKGVYFVQH